MNILLAAAIILGACALTCGLLYAIHRFGQREVLLADTTRGAGVYGVVGTSFAVLLAFVVLVAFQSYEEARNGAAEEADAVLEQFRTSSYFPAAQDREIRGELICYGRAVASLDWPAMENHHGSPVVNHWSLALQRSYVALPVRSLKEQAAFADMLELRDARLDARRQRLTQAVPIITTPVWFFIGIGALLNIAFVLIFVDRRSEAVAVQMVLMGAVTAIVVAGLLLIWFLDHPYQGADGSIEPVEIERTVAAMEQESPDLKPPCTEDGEPFGGRVESGGSS